MSRINTNVASLRTVFQLNRNQGELSTRLQRLSTGLKINSGKDAPAGLIASETMRSEMAGLAQAIDNSQRAGHVVNTAEGALQEVSSLLLQVQALTNQAANTGGMSPDEIAANQLQLDAILTSINRVANTTQFAGIKLLNGQLDYVTSGVATSAMTGLTVNQAKLPDNGSISVVVQVTGSADTARLTWAGPGLSAAGAVTIEVAGNDGVEQLSFAGSAHASAIVFAVNQLKVATGVSATLSGGGIRFSSRAYGAKQFVSVQAISGGPFATGTTYGRNASVNINGTAADSEGLTASLRGDELDLTIDLSAAFGSRLGTKTFAITGGGAKFQLGSKVAPAGQVNMGIAAVTTSRLGNDLTGYLNEMASGGDMSLVGGNTVAAQRALDVAIRQITRLRGRLGAFQKNVLETNVNSLSVALENVTASESSIRDADFAEETSKMTRGQILVQATTSVLAQANSTPQSVLSLLGR
ncbi:MAG TPA: flagellin [Tepidisphaeraceae bacterium]|nr:flagellin [Tepidisphaeraceae bacterium]